LATFSNFHEVYLLSIAMKFSTCIKHLMGFIVQYKLQNTNILFQYWKMACYITGCSLCPHALGSVIYMHLGEHQCVVLPFQNTLSNNFIKCSYHHQGCNLLSSFEVVAGLWFAISTPINKSFRAKLFARNHVKYTEILYSAFWRAIQVMDTLLNNIIIDYELLITLIWGEYLTLCIEDPVFTKDRLVLNGVDECKVFVLKMAKLCRVFGKCIQVRY